MHNRFGTKVGKRWNLEYKFRLASGEASKDHYPQHVSTVSVVLRKSSIHFGIFIHSKVCTTEIVVDRLCGIVLRVPGYRSRGPGFDSQRYQNF
jgi:hypothetical protein